MSYSINPHIQRWLDMVENGEIVSCLDQQQLARHVKQCFETEDIYTDDEQLEKYLGLVKYFPFERLFEWEAFCISLHLCTFWRETGRPRWPDLFLLIGRGAGKDGYIALEGLCVISPYSNLREYDVDICANAEEQAMRPVNDVLTVLSQHDKKMKKYFYWTKEKVLGIKHKGAMRGRTNRPGSKDGMRSGMVVFNEIHQYANYENIRVFTTGLGKKTHPRRLYVTTNGDVRDGPLDDILIHAEQILKGGIGDNGLLPFVCRLDDKKEADDPCMWPKANPSLPYLPDLLGEIEKEYGEWKQNPVANSAFMTKRMNRPQSDSSIAVTEWENIAATNRDMPDLRGWECVCGIDYASVRDLASVNLHFRHEDERYDINHSWLCLQSKDLHKITAPWREWAEMGLLTPVDEVEINPGLICKWIEEQAALYQIKMLALDNARLALLKEFLARVGFDDQYRKNLKLVKSMDIVKVHPLIESVFANQKFVWGDNPVLRWATNNTKLERSKRDNYFYGKIEARSRKTDPFFALVAAMTIEDQLNPGGAAYADLPVIVC